MALDVRHSMCRRRHAVHEIFAGKINDAEWISLALTYIIGRPEVLSESIKPKNTNSLLEPPHATALTLVIINHEEPRRTQAKVNMMNMFLSTILP